MPKPVRLALLTLACVACVAVAVGYYGVLAWLMWRAVVWLWRAVITGGGYGT
jgi:hypothetical protein